MSEKRIETGIAPELIVRCRGDLQIGGWAESAVLIKGDPFTTNADELQAKADVEKTNTELKEAEQKQAEAGVVEIVITEEELVEDKVVIEGSGDLVLMVPAGAKLVVEEVHGDLQVRNLDGEMNLTDASGDVSLRNLGDVAVTTVFGDIAVRNLSGNFSAKEIMADASLRNVESLQIATIYGDCAIGYANGDVQLESVMGDISLKTVNGNVEVATGHRDINLRNLGGLVNIDTVHGDIRLRGGLAAGKHHLNATGDIVVRWPIDEPLTVTATAAEFRNRLPLVDVVEEDGSFSGRLGDGETFLFLKANGRIIFKEADGGGKSWDDDGQSFDFAFDLNGLGDHIASEIGVRMADLSAKLENQFGPEYAARMEEMARAAAAKAEKAAEKAMKKAEKAAKKARWQSGQWPPPPPKPPAAPTRSSKEKRASEEEQLKILRMVENGIISPDEANELLQAILA